MAQFLSATGGETYVHFGARAFRNRAALFSVWSVYEADQPVLAPTFITRLRAHRIQLSPSSGHLDPILGDATAHQDLLDPVGTSLRETKVVEPLAS